MTTLFTPGYAGGDLGGTVGFALGDPSQQINGAALGRHLEGIGKQVLGIDEGCLDLAGDEGVVGTRGQAGQAGDRQFVDHRLDAFDGGGFTLDRLLHLRIAHFAGQQDAAVVGIDIDMAGIADELGNARLALDDDAAILGLRAQRAAVGGRQCADHGAARSQGKAALQAGSDHAAQQSSGQGAS